MDSVLSWFVLCIIGLCGCGYILYHYVKCNTIKRDPFEAYNKNKRAWWED